MRTNALKGFVATAAAVLLGGVAVCTAQERDEGSTNRPVITVTAGQGGYIRLPDLRPAEHAFALTGERNQADRSARAWQREAGPRYRVGQAEITLPAAR